MRKAAIIDALQHHVLAARAALLHLALLAQRRNDEHEARFWREHLHSLEPLLEATEAQDARQMK